jgi:Rrf2 family protein
MGGPRAAGLISTTAEYALRAVVFLAREPGRPRTTQQVAEATRVPGSYLSKVLQALVRGGIIESVRGIYGGYRLAGAPDGLTVLAVINSVDPIRRIRACPLGIDAHGVRLCPLHRRLDEAIALAEQAFAETTIAGLLVENELVGNELAGGSQPLVGEGQDKGCAFPMAAEGRQKQSRRRAARRRP